MKKSDIASRVADRISLSRSAAGNAVDAMFEAVGEALANGEEVWIVGFGTFTRKSRPGPYRAQSADRRKPGDTGVNGAGV